MAKKSIFCGRNIALFCIADNDTAVCCLAGGGVVSAEVGQKRAAGRWCAGNSGRLGKNSSLRMKVKKMLLII